MSNRASQVFAMSRRQLLAMAGAAALARPAAARSDFRIDWQGAPEVPEIAEALAAQVAMVEALPVSPATMAWFRSQTITVDRQPGTRTRAGPRGIFFSRDSAPGEGPVLLHEMIHRYQLERMPRGRRNPDVARFFAAAREQGYAPRAYMMSDSFEFFAMTASAVLHGTINRPPFTRANVKAKSPELYAFIVREFGFREA